METTTIEHPTSNDVDRIEQRLSHEVVTAASLREDVRGLFPEDAEAGRLDRIIVFPPLTLAHDTPGGAVTGVMTRLHSAVTNLEVQDYHGRMDREDARLIRRTAADAAIAFRESPTHALMWLCAREELRRQRAEVFLQENIAECFEAAATWLEHGHHPLHRPLFVVGVPLLSEETRSALAHYVSGPRVAVVIYSENY